MNHKFIAIEGVIGVGKTTLTRLLKPYFQANVLLEVFEENPFLADFYSDRHRYAFQTQLFFLLSRYQQHMQTVPKALSQGNVLSDYTFAKDELFAWLNLKDDELAMYGRVQSALADKIQRPNLLVYLKADHDAVMQRIAQRDRPYERDMDPEYIRQLSSAYEAWVDSLSDFPVLTLDMTHRDVLTSKDDLEFVYQQISQALSKHGDTSVDTAHAHLAPSYTNDTLSNYQALLREISSRGESTRDPLNHYLRMITKIGNLGTSLSQERDFTDENQANINQEQQTAVADQLSDLLSSLLQLANDFNVDLATHYKKKIDDAMRNSL